ncbi:pleckstrin homology domain-containing family G member 1 isoform X2, partial [Brachionus plicatilis]
MSSNFIKLDETLNANICLSYYKPDLSDYKLDIETNLKRQQEKFNILKEILSSEKKYLNDIREIVEGYYEELRKSCPDDAPYHIFSNIKEIYEFSKNFYCLLESSTNDEAGIASCFIKKHKTFLRLYSTYCQNYKTAYNIADRLEREHHTAKVIQKVRLKYGHCLKLATYLQLPVLRITKYHLLLQRYLKLLDKESLGYNVVLEALNLMKQVNDQINNDMPKDEASITFERITSTSNIQNLIKLFGSILKQGNLVLNETKKVHYVIVFQTMLVIRKSDSPYKVLHSISNEYLALMPKSSCSNKTKYFTIIDYSQSKENEMWQFTFKSRSLEDKQSWQSSVLSCMLNGYGKKLSDNIRSKVMKMDSFSESTSLRKSSNDIFRQKFNNIKKFAEFRSSVKPEIIDNTKNFSNLEDEQKCRFSTPQSRLSKILDRTIESGTLSLRRLITKPKEDHRIEKLFSNDNTCQETRPVSSAWSSVEMTDNSEFRLSIQSENSSPVETPRESQHLDQDLNSSFEEISNSTDENEQILKSEKNLAKQNNNCQTDTLSKSSMNSEEGYFSNHDSSISTLVLEPVAPNDDSICTLKNFPLTISTPELKQIDMSDNDAKVFDIKNKFNSNDIMSMSMNEPLTYFVARNYTDPVHDRKHKKSRTMCFESKNLTSALNDLNDANNSEMLSMSMTSFSRIKNLCNIFEERSVAEYKDISKSINYLQEKPAARKKLTMKAIQVENGV